MLPMCRRLALLMAVLPIMAPTATGHQPPPPPAPSPPESTEAKVPPPPDRSVVAATVNGRKIPEIAVYRAMVRVPPKYWKETRPEILNFLIENNLIDQYLELIKVPVDKKEVEEKLQQIKDELKKSKQDLPTLLKKLYLTEDELREQIVGAIRWEKFVKKYGPEKELRKLFNTEKERFDGTMVKARHLLIKPKDQSQAALQAAQQQAAELKKQIEAAAAAELAKTKLPEDKDGAAKVRLEAFEKAFAAFATVKSDCPSKKKGGELGWFPRMGRMVEPFAKAAFATPVGQISQPTKTEFGYHLILPTDRKPGRDVKFEDVQPFVQEVYAERLRKAILLQMRPRAKIVIHKGSTAR